MYPYSINNMMPNYYNPTINGRIVTSVDEVRASQIALDGSISYFPSPAENKIYAKFVGMNGLPIIKMYELQQEVDNKEDLTKTLSKTQEDFAKYQEDIAKSQENLLKRIVSIENTLKEMRRNEPIEPFTAI